MQPIQLHWIDYSILLAYVAFVLGIGFALTRYMKTSSDFLTSGRSIPTWVTGLAFISANLGALLVVYGAATSSNTEMYQHSLGKNINLIWGIVLLIFGVLMLVGAFRGGKKKNEDGK